MSLVLPSNRKEHQRLPAFLPQFQHVNLETPQEKKNNKTSTTTRGFKSGMLLGLGIPYLRTSRLPELARGNRGSGPTRVVWPAPWLSCSQLPWMDRRCGDAGGSGGLLGLGGKKERQGKAEVNKQL